MVDIWRFDINFIEVLKVPVSTFVDAGLMEVPWKFDVGFMEILKVPKFIVICFFHKI
jgi:hypothetical protein